MTYGTEAHASAPATPQGGGNGETRVAIMQPYFLPYIGYFQLINAADVFIVYDNIKYTKKGWINRNRLLSDGHDVLFSLPLRKASDTLDVVERHLAADFKPVKLLGQFHGAYAAAPYYPPTRALLERIVQADAPNLFAFILNSIEAICGHLGVRSRIVTSSALDIDHRQKGQDKVLALCEATGATCYINAIGGTALYDHASFAARGLQLQFLKSRPIEYPQFGAPFVPWLSIIDVLMFNPVEHVQAHLLHHYDLV